MFGLCQVLVGKSNLLSSIPCLHNLNQIIGLPLIKLPNLINNSIQNLDHKSIHTSSSLQKNGGMNIPRTPENYCDKNKYKWPIQQPGEERRLAFIRHSKHNVKGSTKKFWYPMSFIRGMTIDEAIDQCKFSRKNKCAAVAELLEEAREKAVKDQNVEFATNLWVAQTKVSRGWHMKGLRRHARGMPGIIHYWYSHLNLTLEEGVPPKFYNYFNSQPTPEEMLTQWIGDLRKRSPENFDNDHPMTKFPGRSRDI